MKGEKDRIRDWKKGKIRGERLGDGKKGRLMKKRIRDGMIGRLIKGERVNFELVMEGQWNTV